MAEEHPGVAALKEGFKYFEKADMHGLSQLFADDVEWVVTGRSPLSGTKKGKIELFSFFGNLIRISKGTWKTELLDVLANDERAVAIIRATAKGPDADLDVRGAAIFETRGTPKIHRVVFTWEDQYAVDAFYKGNDQ